MAWNFLCSLLALSAFIASIYRIMCVKITELIMLYIKNCVILFSVFIFCFYKNYIYSCVSTWRYKMFVTLKRSLNFGIWHWKYCILEVLIKPCWSTLERCIGAHIQCCLMYGQWLGHEVISVGVVEPDLQDAIRLATLTGTLCISLALLLRQLCQATALVAQSLLLYTPFILTQIMVLKNGHLMIMEGLTMCSRNLVYCY